MLPCQLNCASFENGCHKTCTAWKAMQEEQKIRREAKKRYLQYHSVRCAQTLRQLRSMQVRHGVW